ncbi:snRNA-activating protein of 50kDa MW C terminal-domain-containing protein [Phlebopus sp. FC_14]|nr:snRNA-activating protein of 50kDa MW C terminal-domain-containing protein [Phlebopus sp. FC_14]
MNVDLNRAYDSFFGPPSDRIPIREFLDKSRSLPTLSAQDILSHAGWRRLSEDERRAIEAECSGGVSEVKATIEDAWNNPILSAHLYRAHDAALVAVQGQAGSAQRGRKRKHASSTSEESDAPPEVRALQEKLDAISLRCWGFSSESALFMRTSKNSDFNALRAIQKSGQGSLPPNAYDSHHVSTPDQGPSSRPTAQVPTVALITLTIYNRVPWVQSYLVRHSQHAVLSSQTLLDFVRAIPCDSSDMPAEQVDEEGNVIGYTYEGGNEGQAAEEGCLLLIDDVVYGDGRPGVDYADKLLLHLQHLPEEKRPKVTKSPTSLGETVFDTLTLRVNQPYWMLHQGNCEHFIVVDQIRLSHPADLPSGYPLTLHVTPTLSELCRACSKVPAVLAILGDIRLGESPCLVCAPCWRNMGPPRKTDDEDEDEVTVVPLPRKKRVLTDGEVW